MKICAIYMGLLCTVLLVSCNSHKEEKHEERTFQVTHPIYKDTAITKAYVSQIHAIRNIEVRTMEKGYLEKIREICREYVTMLKFKLNANLVNRAKMYI